jgi:hypothetical protein
MVAATMGKAKVARLLEDVTKHVGADGGPVAVKHSIAVRFKDVTKHVGADGGPVAVKHSIAVRFVDSETEE